MDRDSRERDTGTPTPGEASEGYKPLQAEEEDQKFGLYPPDIAPTVEIGGSPEEKQVLNEEMTS
jgi:hypothetical protein